LGKREKPVRGERVLYAGTKPDRAKSFVGRGGIVKKRSSGRETSKPEEKERARERKGSLKGGGLRGSHTARGNEKLHQGEGK